MRFSLSSTALSSSLSSLSRVINSKNTMQILDCFLFEIKDGQLVVTASDGENVMTAQIPLDETDGEGSFAITSRIILDAVRELPEQPLVFDLNPDDYSVRLNYQNGLYQFMAQADDFPRPVPLSGNVTTIVMDAGQLQEAISRSLFATAQLDSRPVMNGIYFDLTEGCLAIVATDAQKLVRNRMLTVKSDTPASFILPKKPAQLLKNVLSKESGDVVIKFDESHAVISYASGVIICRLIDGRYPRYNAVIPKDNPNRLTIDRGALLSALRRVVPFASESSMLVRVRLEAGRIELSSEDIDFSTSAKESLICEYDGQPMSIGFKGSALTEIVNNLQSDDIMMLLADPSRSGLVFPAEQPENEEILMLLMPMLLND